MIEIRGVPIGTGYRPYTIAELSCNHNGDLQTAMNLIRAAKIAGANAVKFQAYTADTITLNSDKGDFLIKEGPWAGWRLYDLYKKTETPFEWFPVLFRYADSLGITAFASVFDETSIDMLEDCRCPAYKIASFEAVDIPLIKYAENRNKPLFVSTGMGGFKLARQIDGQLDGDTDLIFLHCVSGYPTPVKESRLSEISRFRDWFIDCGISDHSIGNEVVSAAVALGASVIEKHFMLDGMETMDSRFSLTPAQFTSMAKAAHDIWDSMKSKIEPKSEYSSKPFRRSLYVVQDIKAGEIFTCANVRSIRPGFGLPPIELAKVLGATAKCDIAKGTAFTLDFIR